MKLLLIATLALTCLSSFASDELLNKCGPVAAKKVTKSVGKDYDKNGIWTYQCVLAPNKAVVICELGANKGDGAATDTYQAVLDKACTKVLRIDVIGIE
jgi:hypothetical protein